MLGSIRRRLSFANVISLVALFAALGGTAAASHLIGSSEIENGGVRNADLGSNAVSSSKILNNNVRNIDLGTNAVNGAKVADGTLTLADFLPGEVSPRLYAVVNANGTLARGTPGATSVPAGTPGLYNVTFPRDVSGCAYTASVALVAQGADANDNPPAGEAGVSGLAGNPAAVRVRTRDSDGKGATKPFHLIVIC